MIAGAIIASRPPGYVVYPGYAQPVYGPGCYWASQPVYNAAGRVVGYTGQPVQVCPLLKRARSRDCLRGTQFTATGREGDWVQVENTRLKGWINSQFLAPDKPQ